MRASLLIGWCLVALIMPAGAVTCQEAWEYSQTHTKREQWAKYRSLSEEDKKAVRECIKAARKHI